MNRPRLFLTLTLALLGSLPAWAAGASARVGTPQPQRTAGGAAMNVRAIQNAVPTLELLITVKLLADLIERQKVVPDIQSRQALGGLLRPLLSVTELRPADARGLNAALSEQLSPAEDSALRAARAALEARAQAFMARARFAAPDGPPNLTLIRYGLTVPGGQATVNSVVGTNFNPYAQAAVNASVLERLLGLLEPAH